MIFVEGTIFSGVSIMYYSYLFWHSLTPHTVGERVTRHYSEWFRIVFAMFLIINSAITSGILLATQYATVAYIFLIGLYIFSFLWVLGLDTFLELRYDFKISQDLGSALLAAALSSIFPYGMTLWFTCYLYRTWYR